ncbi:MAG: glycoside hydrolase family 130 protein [Spirochaetales bacterium]|nr:glycoside hydrolase family 130 protein [Spirochaetales bacterium]
MKVKRYDIELRPDSTRVLYRPFIGMSGERMLRIIARVQSLSEEEVQLEYKKVMEDFHNRHLELHDFLLKNYKLIHPMLIKDQVMSEERKLLLGAFFTQEYSLESAALFNPSMIWHPDQSELPEGAKRFIISLRATGEGHISSISFRSGIVTANGAIKMDAPSQFVTLPKPKPDIEYNKKLFTLKLGELGLYNEVSTMVMDKLDNNFTLKRLNEVINFYKRQDHFNSGKFYTVTNGMITLAQSNYKVKFLESQDISQRTIFPYAPAEVNGIEDARFVEFTDDDGEKTFYAMYTAYDGKVILPQMLETRDFLEFDISTLNGPAIENKGLALFPRKINGKYMMISRQDNESMFIMESDNIHFWYNKEILVKPAYPWEFVQIGNCGSPIETDEGWILLTHGVGPMREYAIGAVLLDLKDPKKVIGRLAEPLLAPNENEREGYVPNVVYSCGGQIHNDRLYIPYAMSDYASTFASVSVKELLKELKKNKI